MQQNADPDLLLAEDMARFYADPLGFVMYAYPWDEDPALQIVKLPEPWCFFYGSEYGPDAWACEFLEGIGEQVKEREFDGFTAVEPIREATSSGHGIGKSAITAWLVDWIMSTRPYAKGVVTANTADQLASKTWAEIAKWTKKCITGHWFDVATGKGAMRMTHKDAPESWRVDAQTCREENSESFAGLHAANSTPFYIYDEASAVPDAIWEVSEGGMTDGEPMWFAFGNPTRNSGRFFECFNRQKHRWNHRQVDSRDVAITNKKQIQEWIDDYGEDSDFVRVRVRGVFPRAGSTQFIDGERVFNAAHREVDSSWRDPIVVGVDVARFGDDQSVIRTRVGRDLRQFEPLKFRGMDTMQLAARVAEHCNNIQKVAGRQPDAVFIDGGGVGGGVVDRLRQLGFDVHEVNFGGKANDSRKYADKGAEMWGTLREALEYCAIPDDPDLHTDLTSREYGFDKAGRIRLESKDDMKKRGLASPDDGDSCGLLYAQPVQAKIAVQDDAQHPLGGAANKRREYDPHRQGAQAIRRREYNPRNSGR